MKLERMWIAGSASVHYHFIHVHLQSAPPEILADFQSWLGENLALTFDAVPDLTTYEILVAGDPTPNFPRASPLTPMTCNALWNSYAIS
jgi:hypothetical protein